MSKGNKVGQRASRQPKPTAISIFSIFAVSMIQQNTPDALIGKIMALFFRR